MEKKERYEQIGYCRYRDTETGVIGYNFVELLNQQDKEIKDLESKLAESKSEEEDRTEALKATLELKEDCEREIYKLKQQLKDTEESYNNTMRYLNKTRSELLNLPKKILKDIQENFDWKQCCEIRKYYDQQYIWFNYVAFNDFLDTILKEYQK